MLRYGKLEAVVSIEESTVSKPLSEKVLDDMRSCGASIVHVEEEQVLQDAEGTERKLLNENALIEIGASMALYGRRFILLVKKGIDLPSDLQGLYKVLYEGESLDATEAFSLMDAIADLENHTLPEEADTPA